MIENIRNRIEKIKYYLNLIETLKNDCKTRFDIDPIYRGSLLYYLYLTSDSCISLAEMVIKYKKLRTPQSYHEAIDILGENGVLQPEFAYEFAYEFAKIAGLRNFLAHDYEKIDSKIICNQILSKLNEIREYLNQIEKSLDLK
ncbi:type VII toxin-antitoxin system HepT family RNase toxin [Thermodesulfovibrio hydrogeniphilus]